MDKNQLLVQRSFVNGSVDDVKTEYSQDYVPLHLSLTEIVLKWSTKAVPTEEGWVLANPRTNRPYYPTEIQKRHLRSSGCCVVECPTRGAVPGVWCDQDQKTGNGVRMLLHRTRVRNFVSMGASAGTRSATRIVRGWTGAPMKVQQELMRHPSIQTTMNVYGQAVSSSKREANGKVVEMVLKPLKASA